MNMIEVLMWIIAIFAVVAQLWIETKNKTDEEERKCTRRYIEREKKMKSDKGKLVGKYSKGAGE